MSFNITYTTVIEADSASGQDTFTVSGNLDSLAADYASKLTFKLNAGQEINVEIPGLNAIVSLMLLADNPVNISLTVDGQSVPVYDGVFTTKLSKFFGDQGIIYDHIKVIAGNAIADVTLVIIGKQDLPNV